MHTGGASGWAPAQAWTGRHCRGLQQASPSWLTYVQGDPIFRAVSPLISVYSKLWPVFLDIHVRGLQ
jgi:hypothetical protein